MTDDEKDSCRRLAERYQNGETLEGIASADGVSSYIVRKALVKSGVKIRNKGPRPGWISDKEKVREIIRRRQENKETYDKIGRSFGISKQAVWQLFKRHA